MTSISLCNLAIMILKQCSLVLVWPFWLGQLKALIAHFRCSFLYDFGLFGPWTCRKGNMFNLEIITKGILIKLFPSPAIMLCWTRLNVTKLLFLLCWCTESTARIWFSNNSKKLIYCDQNHYFYGFKKKMYLFPPVQCHLIWSAQLAICVFGFVGIVEMICLFSSHLWHKKYVRGRTPFSN